MDIVFVVFVDVVIDMFLSCYMLAVVPTIILAIFQFLVRSPQMASVALCLDTLTVSKPPPLTAIW